LLNDPKANRVRGVAKLNKKDARSETGLFLLEGLQGLKEALDRPKLIREIFATGEVISANQAIFAKAAAARVEVVEVTEQVLAALADTRTPQGVVAVCEQAHVSFEDVLSAEPKLLAMPAPSYALPTRLAQMRSSSAKTAWMSTIRRLFVRPPVRFFTCQ
jgi:TrmH family RNA methyltransferase